MAKRKRLSLPQDIPTEQGQITTLETKSYVNGWEGNRTTRAAPISQMAGDAATRAALDELAQEMRTARDAGRIVLNLRLDQIDAAYLVRDRIAIDDEDMDALKRSLHTRGQQTPLEVAELGQGRFGLISGWRRLTALQALHRQTGEARFGAALCLVRAPQEAADAYLAMVEENEIRSDISYYERARIAARATEQGVFETEKKALLGLFASVSYAKRSKIRSFIVLYQALDDVLRFPAALTERTGLALVQGMQADETLADRLRAALLQAAADTPEAEQAAISALLSAPSVKVAKTGSDQPSRDDVSDELTIHRTGARLVVSGSGVDAAFEQRLRDWVQQDRARSVPRLT